MSLESFYGGRQAAPFIIKAAFDSVQEMKDSFAQGANYTDVWYGDYCIIDTPNKNHPDNGKIFRRGLDYQNAETRGSIYVGQIVGPSSGTPYFSMSTIQSVKDVTNKAYGDYTYLRYPIGKKADGSYELTDGSSNKPIYIDNFSTTNNTSLVPGKYNDTAGNEAYNDTIKYTWCNVRMDDADADSYFYVGFEIPYMITDYTIHSVSPYNEYGTLVDKYATVDRIDDGSHPFYTHWDLGLPKGIKGDTLRNLRVITPTATDTIYSTSAITIDGTTGETKLGNAGYAGLDDDIANKRQIVVFDYFVYDKLRNPTPITIYLGDFNIIQDITVKEDGTLVVDYTHNDNDSFDNAIKWIKSISLNTSNGHFVVEYNNGDANYENDLDWVKNIVLQNDGTLNIYHTVSTSDTIEPNKIKWVNNAELNVLNGEFKMTFNDGSELKRTLDWVRDIEIDEATGEIILIHTDSSIGRETLSAKLKLVTKAEASTDGVVTFTTNTGESFNIKNKGTQTDFHIQTVDDIDINTGILDDKRVQVKYNTKTAAEFIGAPINFVQDMIVRQEDYHLLVLFNDPTHRAVFTDLTNPDENGNGKDANGISWYHNIAGSTGTIYDTSVYWRDYGAIKDQAGVLIGFGITDEDVGTGAAGSTNKVIDYLNDRFPSGLTGAANELSNGVNVKGKIVTYSATEGDKQEFYAYDYNKSSWYYLGEISDTSKRDVGLQIPGSITTNAESLKNLSVKGLMFMGKSFKTADSAIPNYWDINYVRS